MDTMNTGNGQPRWTNFSVCLKIQDIPHHLDKIAQEDHPLLQASSYSFFAWESSFTTPLSSTPSRVFNSKLHTAVLVLEKHIRLSWFRCKDMGVHHSVRWEGLHNNWRWLLRRVFLALRCPFVSYHNPPWDFCARKWQGLFQRFNSTPLRSWLDWSTLGPCNNDTLSLPFFLFPASSWMCIQ